MSMDKLFDEIHNLPNIPKIIQELIDNFNNLKVNADQISKKVQMDQLISAKGHATCQLGAIRCRKKDQLHRFCRCNARI